MPLNIRQFNRNKEFPAFFFYNHDLAMLMEKIHSQFADFTRILQNLSPIVLQQFALSSLVDEVHSTSSIEGIHSTHRELKDILDGKSNNVHFSTIIKKYDLLISEQYPLFWSCKDIRDFYDEFAHADAIAENPKNKLDGVLFRKEAVDVHSASGKIIHRGITPEDKIITALSDALDFLNDDTYSALVRIAVFHYLFVYIHPFYDGNGRTARFISSVYIAKHLHPLIALRLAVTIKHRKGKYYSLLKDTGAEINCGDLTPFICGFLEFVADTIFDVTRKLKRKISQLERFRRLLSKVIPENGIEAVIMDLLLQAGAFYGRGLTMDEIMPLTGKSRNTVKEKFANLPVRTVKAISRRKKFYKIDWKILRNLLRYGPDLLLVCPR
ncbi:MAG: Fic family protein [Synergistaceae bacterium]|nr:Fic family protein [Synergistaceae bacterium]